MASEWTARGRHQNGVVVMEISAKLSPAATAAVSRSAEKTKRTLSYIDQRIDAVLQDDKLSTKSERFLNDLWYGEPADTPLTMAQRSVRAALARAFTTVMLRQCDYEPAATKGDNRLQMLTTCPDVGYSKYRSGTVNFDAVRKHFAHTMQAIGLEGIGVIDTALIDQDWEGSPAYLGLHYHAICQAKRGGRLSPPSNAARRESLGRNKFGLAVSQQKIKASPLHSSNVADMCAYVTKVNVALAEDHKTFNYGTQQHWSCEHTLRTLELLSHLTPSCAIVGIGATGRHRKHECLTRMAAYLGVTTIKEGGIEHHRLQRCWQRLYREMGTDIKSLAWASASGRECKL